MPEPNHLLRAARERTPSHIPGECMSRRELVEAVATWLWNTTHTRYDLDTRLLSKWERGHVRWPSAHYRSALRAVLGVATDAELGFCHPRRSRVTVTDVDRKNFLQLALGLGAGVVTSASLTELVAVAAPTPVPSVVGRTQIEEIRAATRTFSGWDMLYGGGMAREAVAAQLRYYAKLLQARCAEKLRGELYSAVGDLGNLAAFMAFDVYAHEDVQRLHRFALGCAEQAEDWGLRAAVLADMARHSLWRGDAESSLTYIEFAQVRSDRLTAAQRAVLASHRATALARLGRAEDAARAVGAADQEFSHSNAADEVYVRYYDSAEHAGATGYALSALAVQGRFVSEAAARLSAAIDSHDNSAARSRALCQVRLAALTMVTGDPIEAAATGATALDSAGTIRSRRMTDELRTLDRAAQTHTAIPEVAQLRHRIGDVLPEST